MNFDQLSSEGETVTFNAKSTHQNATSPFNL